MSKDERIADYIARNPAASDRTIAKNLARHGVKVADVEAVRNGIPCEATAKPSAGKKSGRKGRSFEDFQRTHDVTHIIVAKVAELLPTDGDEYFTDHEFREACGCPIHTWRRFADDDRFGPWRLVRGQHNYWAPKTMIPKMRQILGI